MVATSSAAISSSPPKSSGSFISTAALVSAATKPTEEVVGSDRKGFVRFVRSLFEKEHAPEPPIPSSSGSKTPRGAPARSMPKGLVFSKSASERDFSNRTFLHSPPSNGKASETPLSSSPLSSSPSKNSHSLLHSHSSSEKDKDKDSKHKKKDKSSSKHKRTKSNDGFLPKDQPLAETSKRTAAASTAVAEKAAGGTSGAGLARSGDALVFNESSPLFALVQQANGDLSKVNWNAMPGEADPFTPPAAVSQSQSHSPRKSGVFGSATASSSAPDVYKEKDEEEKSRYRRMITNSVKLPKTIFNNLLAKGKSESTGDLGAALSRASVTSKKSDPPTPPNRLSASMNTKALMSFFHTLKDPSLEHYTELQQLLSSPPFYVASALCHVITRTESDAVAKALVHINMHNGTVFLMLSGLIQREVEDTVEAGTLFRGNSMASKCLTAYSKFIGKEFLRDTLKPLIEEVRESNKGWEINPIKAEEGESVEENVRNIREMAERFLTRIVEHGASSFPNELRMICKELRDHTEKKFPESVNTVIGGYFFLRLICPATVSPEGFGIVDGVVNERARRALVYISKLLQSIANGIKFSKKEEYMLPLNDFIDSNFARLTTLFSQLATVAPSAEEKQVSEEKEKGKEKEKEEEEPSEELVEKRRTRPKSIGTVGAIATRDIALKASTEMRARRQRTNTDPLGINKSRVEIEKTLLVEQLNNIFYQLITNLSKVKEHMSANGQDEQYELLSKTVQNLRSKLGVDAYLNSAEEQLVRSSSGSLSSSGGGHKKRSNSNLGAGSS